MQLFLRHPNSVGESYLEHLLHAAGFGSRMVLAGLACLVHGVFPFLFPTTGSRQVVALHDGMIANRVKQPCIDRSSRAG